MSLLAPGNYVITNQVPSINGDILAMTYNGAYYNNVTVTGIQDVSNPSLDQVWAVSDYDAVTQTISPQSDSTVQIAQGPGVLQTFPASGLTWSIQSTGIPLVYTVQDGAYTVFWDLAITADGEVYDGEVVSLNAEGGLPTENWLFHPLLPAVSTP